MNNCEFDVNEEVATKIDAKLESLDRVDERRENLESILQQCAHEDVDSPELALHYIRKAMKDRVISPIEADRKMVPIMAKCIRRYEETRTIANHLRMAQPE